MAKQRLHTNLAEIDVLTREELAEENSSQLDAFIRERYRGIELQRVPLYPVTATAATVQLYAPNDATPWGPEQGDVWRIFRVIVKSSVAADTAKYVVYKGSTPSDLQNAYQFRFMLDSFVGGATPGQNVNVGVYSTRITFLQPGEQIYAQVTGATATNQYIFEAEGVRCPAEMKGKII